MNIFFTNTRNVGINYNFLTENGEVETEDASNTHSASFLLHIKYQRTLAGSVSMAEDPKDLWPIDINVLPDAATDESLEMHDNME